MEKLIQIKCALLLVVAGRIRNGSWDSAEALLEWHIKVFGPLGMLASSYLLTKTGIDWSEPNVIQLLLAGRMTKRYVERVLHENLMWKDRLSPLMARWIGSHFVAPQRESARKLFYPSSKPYRIGRSFDEPDSSICADDADLTIFFDQYLERKKDEERRFAEYGLTPEWYPFFFADPRECATQDELFFKNFEKSLNDKVSVSGKSVSRILKEAKDADTAKGTGTVKGVL